MGERRQTPGAGVGRDHLQNPSAQLKCTLLAGCVPEQLEPWLILTD
ncbi:MAG: hypothetical protein ACYDBJ_22500 [Aggregatilineales bacterium]